MSDTQDDPAPSVRPKSPAGPLAGLRVLDFGHTVMGPTTGLVLADLGAEVIRIEPAPAGDPTRRLKGFGTGYFPFYNRNKQSLAVDLKSDAGREIVERLLATADVMLENFGPGTIARLGLDYDSVAARHPHIVYLSLKGYLPGPYEQRAALDEIVQMQSGLAYMTGPPGQPLRAGASVTDVMGGMFGVIGVLAALRDRDATGKGSLVRSALFESAVFLMGQHLAYAALADHPVPPMPARVSAWAIYDLFTLADDTQFFLGITSDKHWRAFCDAFARPDLLADESLSTNNRRIEAKPRLKPLIADILAQHDLPEAARLCEAARLPFAPVARPEDLFDDPHLRAGGRLLETALPGGVQAGLPGLPLEIGAFRPGLRNPPPGLGQDSRGLLAALGYDTAAVACLEEAGIIACAPAPE
ncbi:CaiB/BaiF CoA transferase family protein [Alkalilacustris brevis]|uniref:CaiB/BaiF CoA transferase family protein n=1 Tax=Alkalilacustris brevis TaxID=2026338 RepID=UPI000E0DF62F|nr:CaiB/BaiF CoA-transferase family protein [Alkalilacustris brevis]